MVEYKNVTDLPIMDEATESTHVIVEDGGSFKRMSGDKLGGGGVKTAIIKSAWYDEFVDGFANGGAMESETETNDYTCINMTFDEAYETLASKQPMKALLMSYGEGSPYIVDGIVFFLGVSLDGEHRCIGSMFFLNNSIVALYWTEEYGITDYNPYEPNDPE